jgi:pyrroloquinoline-quinone synthase
MAVAIMIPDLDGEYARGEPGIAPQEFLKGLWAERRRLLHAGRIQHPHPFRVALGQGKVPIEGVRGYLKNRHYFLANINRKDAQIIANCPYSDARRMLLSKYIDEEGNDLTGGSQGPHFDMWVKLANALGVSTEEMNSFVDVLPAFRCAVDALFDFTKSHSWLEGLAATYAGEGAAWKRYDPPEEKHREAGYLPEGQAFKKFYGVPDAALEFYHVHEDANTGHDEITETILKKYCTTRELQRKAIAAARFRWEVQQARSDIVYYHYVLGQPR